LGTALTVIQGKAEANEAERVREKKNRGEELTEQEQKTLDDFNERTDFSRQTADLESMMEVSDEPSALGKGIREFFKFGVGKGDAALRAQSVPPPATSAAPIPMPPPVGMEAGRGTGRAPTPATSNPSEGEKAVRAAAAKHGITDPTELNALLAQTGHESGNYRFLTEQGSRSYFDRYEGRRDLGNTQPGDGFKYRGRGYIQLTGRANYEQFAKFSGIDVVNNPDLVATPSVGAEASLWYWKTRVKPNVTDFSDVKHVTRLVNGGLNGLSDREQRFASLMEQPSGGFDFGNVMQTASRASGSQIASASTVADMARMESMDALSMIPSMLGLMTPKTPSTQAQQVSIPSTIDTDLFDALVMRVTEYS
jgi:putative chitinase